MLYWAARPPPCTAAERYQAPSAPANILPRNRSLPSSALSGHLCSASPLRMPWQPEDKRPCQSGGSPPRLRPRKASSAGAIRDSEPVRNERSCRRGAKSSSNRRHRCYQNIRKDNEALSCKRTGTFMLLWKLRLFHVKIGAYFPLS